MELVVKAHMVVAMAVVVAAAVAMEVVVTAGAKLHSSTHSQLFSQVSIYKLVISNFGMRAGTGENRFEIKMAVNIIVPDLAFFLLQGQFLLVI